MKKIGTLPDPSTLSIMSEMISDCKCCNKKDTCKYKEEYSSLKDKYSFLKLECKYFKQDCSNNIIYTY